MLACSSSDSSISIVFWTGESWESKKIISAHTTGCNAVTWCPASLTAPSASDPNKPQTISSVKRLASGGCDNLVKIWKENTDGQWTEEKRLEGHKDWVRDVAWAPNIGSIRHTIASCSQDQRVIIWRCSDLDQVDQWTSEILYTFEDALWHVSWSLCGTILAVSAGDNKISLWKETLEGEWVRLTDAPKNPPTFGNNNNNNGGSSVGHSQTRINKNRMASLVSRIDTGHRDMIHDAQMDFYGTKLATCSSDRSVKIFDVKPDGSQTFITELLGHDGPVWQLSWSHPMHGNLLASCSYDKKVIIWKETSGKWNKFYEYCNHDASVNSVCWAPSEYGLMLACSSSDSSISIVFWT
uniref:Protein SEC13 homolog n=1 Tax=Romanomermis culicivorax TaxID=13658 RepID=A0A915IPK0_ROMCU